MPSLAIIDAPEEVSPAWMSEVLSSQGAPVQVDRISFEKIGTGQTGACYRFHLDHKAAAPSTVILKIAAGTPQQRVQVARGYAAEVLFYDAVAPRSAVRTPKCWFAGIAGADKFTLVLEDARPAVAGEQEAGCTTRQAESALANLARLHASTWNGDILKTRAASLVTTAERADRLAGIYRNAVDPFLDRYDGHFTEEEQQAFREATRFMRDWLYEQRPPQALIHGDYRLDNLLFPIDDSPVMAIDWQTLEVGQPGRDVAYFIATAFDPAARRQLEDRLLGIYHAELLAGGVEGYSLSDCRQDYARGLLQAALITIVGCVFATGVRSEKSDRMFLSMAHRAAQAIQDHSTLSILSQNASWSGAR